MLMGGDNSNKAAGLARALQMNDAPISSPPCIQACNTLFDANADWSFIRGQPFDIIEAPVSDVAA